MNLSTLCLCLQIPIHLPQPLLVDRSKVPAPLDEALAVEDQEDALATHDCARRPGGRRAQFEMWPSGTLQGRLITPVRAGGSTLPHG